MLGIHLGKNVCRIAGLDETGAVVLCRPMKLDVVVDFVVKMPGLIAAMEACCEAHHLGLVLAGKGTHDSADVSGIRASLHAAPCPAMHPIQ